MISIRVDKQRYFLQVGWRARRLRGERAGDDGASTDGSCLAKVVERCVVNACYSWLARPHGLSTGQRAGR